MLNPPRETPPPLPRHLFFFGIFSRTLSRCRRFDDLREYYRFLGVIASGRPLLPRLRITFFPSVGPLRLPMFFRNFSLQKKDIQSRFVRLRALEGVSRSFFSRLLVHALVLTRTSPAGFLATPFLPFLSPAFIFLYYFHPSSFVVVFFLSASMDFPLFRFHRDLGPPGRSLFHVPLSPHGHRSAMKHLPPEGPPSSLVG